MSLWRILIVRYSRFALPEGALDGRQVLVELDRFLLYC
jgi:hypothetical protein